MRKRLIFFAFTLLFALCTVSLYTPSAHAAAIGSNSAKTYTVTPHVSGGGCGRLNYSSSYDIGIKGCISYTWPNVNPDGYVSFYTPKTVINCAAAVILYTPSGQRVGSQQWDCTSAANSNIYNAHYGFSSFQLLASSYYSEMFVTLEYSDHTNSYAGSDSPVLYT
jgi:hypothetical protein